jgi:S1-C subfamily serine protease
MTGILSQLSDDLAATVARGGSGVARVEARRRMPASGIIWSGDGVIVTAHHVIESDENIKVGLPDGSSVTATLAGRDPSTDIAVLRAQASGLTPAARGNAESLKVGHLVLALGRPGQEARATLGMVSAIGKAWRTPAGGNVDRYIQSNVTMYPGFSGGPMVDVDGGVLGLNTSALLRGVSATIPLPTVQHIVETLLSHGKVRRGYLGVGAQPVRLQGAAAQQLGQETGLLIISIEANSPADRNGLLVGDTIVALDGQSVRQLDDLLSLLSGDRVGKSTSIKVVRGGQVQDIAVTIGDRE